jgi:hypothetical protein
VERSGGEAGLRCQGGAEAPDVRGDQITKSAACLGILWNSRGHYGLDIERSQGGVVYVFQCAPSPQQRAFRTGAISVKYPPAALYDDVLRVAFGVHKHEPLSGLSKSVGERVRKNETAAVQPTTTGALAGAEYLLCGFANRRFAKQNSM